MTNQLFLPVQLPDHQTFDNFALGNNQLVVDHLLGLIDKKGSSITYISGGVGTGKTHLMYALCASIDGAVFIDCKQRTDFSWQMLEGLEFSPLICVDNVHDLVNEPEWQTAVFNLINSARENESCHLLFSALMGAGQLALELPDLTSRLLWGLSYHLQPLTEEQTEDLIILRASQRGLDMTSEVAKFLLSRGKRDVASLMDMLEKLDRLSLQQQRRLTIPFVKQLLD